VRASRGEVVAALAPLADQRSWMAVAAERAVSRAMGGSCSMPLAAYATFSGEYLQLSAAWGDPDGQAPLVRARSAAVVADREQAAALGAQVAERLRAAGAAP
ncbi:MAG: hydroxymethylbilane synthase, partial [Comamonadaceae bacterium]